MSAEPVDAKTIVVLEGDETGQELLEESLRVLAPDVIGLELEFPRFDLSLESRRRDRERGRPRGGARDPRARPRPEGGDDHAGRARRRRLPEPDPARGDRREGDRAHRAGAFPGVVPLGGVHAPISIVRMAVGDAYGAKEWREGEGDDEVAFRTERIERRICRAVAEFSFRQAEQVGAKVFGGPKYTVSPTYEGMLKEEMDAAAERHPDVPYEPQLIDATFALLIASAGDPLVIPALNRDGDILSDLVLPLFGSIAGSESLLVAFDDDYEPTRADGRGRARDRAVAARQERREPDGDDPRRRGAALARRRARRSRPAGRFARPASRRSRRASARPTSAGTRARPSSPTR